MATERELHLWLCEYTDELGKRRVTRYLLSEEDARATLRDPERVEHSLEIRSVTPQSMSDFMRSKPTS